MDIDRLDIVISAEASKAEKQINKLMKCLDELSGVLGGLNTSGLSDLSDGVTKLSSAMQSMNGIQTKDFSRLSRNLEKLFEAAKGVNSVNTAGLLGLANSMHILGRVDAKSIDSISGILGKLSGLKADNLPQVSEGLRKAVDAIGALSAVSFNDNNLRNVINSLGRLLKADFGKFNSEQFKEVVATVATLGGLPDISKSVNQLISSLAKLTNAGDKSGLTASSLPILVDTLKTAVRDLAEMPDISAPVNSLISSIARLSNAGKKTWETADGLEKLAKETIKFFEVMQNAPRISNNTLRMTEALSRLASAGDKLGNSTSQVTNVFNKISGLSKKAETQISRAAKSIISSFKSIGSASGSLKTASIRLSTLISGAALIRGVRELANFGKSALELGSNITEVENVVDVSFGNMSKKAYDFAKTATEKFGLSELSAKQYAGTMMAMLKSSGVAQSAAADMSTTLAGLAGDLASFYNIDTDIAFQKIRAGISGEIEPLKQLGINMSVANMEAFALSQGITTAYNSMTQAEKAILRYNYLLSVTGDQQGDFARTAGTWANQVRLLSLNFQSLKAVIGQGLISAILPAVKALNLLLGKLMQVAEAFRRFMYTLAGKKLEGSQGGIVDDLSGLDDVSTGLDDVADAGDNATGGLDNATDSAKKLKKALSALPFDELNKLNEAADDLASAGAGVSGLGGGGVDALNVPSFGDLDDAINSLKDSKVPDEISKWAKQIRDAFLDEDWERLGLVIAQGLNKGLQKVYDVLDWEKVGPKITKFTDAFTRTFNSLTDNLDWDLLGRTIGTGINTTVKTLNQLIEGIDWKNLGRKFATGINGLANEVNWEEFGNLLGNKFMIGWNILYGFVTGLDFDSLGHDFADLLNGAFEKISFSDIGTLLSTGFNGMFEFLGEFARTFHWDDLADNITDGLNTMIHGTDWETAGKNLNAFVTELLGTFAKVAAGTDWEEFGEGIGNALSQVDWGKHLLTAANILIDIFGGLLKGLAKTPAGRFIIAFGVGLTGVKIATHLMPFINIITKFITGETAMEKVSKAFQNLFSTATAGGATAATEALGKIGEAATGAGTAAEGAGKSFSLLNNPLTIMVAKTGAVYGAAILGGKAIGEMADAAAGGNGKLSELGGGIDNLINQLADWEYITGEQKQQLFMLKEELENSNAPIGNYKTAFVDMLSGMGVSSEEAYNAFMSFSGATDEQLSMLTGIVDGLGTSTETMAGKVESSMQRTQTSTTTALNNTSGAYSVTGTIITGVLSTIMKSSGVTWSDVKDKAVGALTNMLSTAQSTMPGLQKSAESAFGAVNSSTNTELGAAAQALFSAFGNMDSETTKKMSSMDSTVISKQASIKSYMVRSWKDLDETISEKLGNMGKSAEDYINSMVNSFSSLKTRVENSIGDLSSIGRSAARSLANGLQSVHIPTPHITFTTSTSVSGNSATTSTSSRVSWYAKGGFPNAGELFMANENGPEMIGKMGHRNVVANNLQITEGIKQAVVEGMMEVAMASSSGQSDDKPYILNVTVKTEDNEVLARAVEKGRLKRDWRYNPSPAY
ncbi:MAG: hypothetical protein Q4F83_04945 [Eubacteriales bacterium]|nr:hypothetical protein [Eubacteriales bacterium]